MNIQSLLKQAQKMQSDLAKLEKDFESRVYAEENDLIRVEVNGKNKVLSIEIKSDSFEDKELIQDMIVISINKANEKASKDREKEMSKLTGGMKMPGVF